MNGSPLRYALALGCAVVVVACTVNPYTRRSQLMLMTMSEEVELGDEAYAQLRSRAFMAPSGGIHSAAVERVADDIIEAALQSKYAEMARKLDWEVAVFADDMNVNAFALPGGIVGVYTGLFPLAKNEAGLAAIVGHEVAHVLARHGAERMSQAWLAETGLLVGEAALDRADVDERVSDLAMAALGVGFYVGVLLPYSRTHESEADYIGLMLAAQAGYDPREAVRVWQRMEEMDGERGLGFLSTHPSHETRIRQLKEWMPEALAIYRPASHEPAAELPRVVDYYGVYEWYGDEE